MADSDPAACDVRPLVGHRADESGEPGRAAIAATAAKHLVIPPADAVTIRRVAGVVHALAREIDVLSRHEDLSLRLMGLVIQDAVNSANAEIRRITESARRRSG